MQSKSGGMRGGFDPLAVQGFLALFPVWESHKDERETALNFGKERPQETAKDQMVIYYNRKKMVCIEKSRKA